MLQDTAECGGEGMASGEIIGLVDHYIHAIGSRLLFIFNWQHRQNNQEKSRTEDIHTGEGYTMTTWHETLTQISTPSATCYFCYQDFRSNHPHFQRLTRLMNKVDLQCRTTSFLSQRECMDTTRTQTKKTKNDNKNRNIKKIYRLTSDVK